MNVTIKISDQICEEASHRAIDAGVSLSSWIAEVIQRELAHTKAIKQNTLLESLGNDELAEYDFEFPRDKSPARDVDFS